MEQPTNPVAKPLDDDPKQWPWAPKAAVEADLLSALIKLRDAGVGDTAMLLGNHILFLQRHMDALIKRVTQLDQFIKVAQARGAQIIQQQQQACLPPPGAPCICNSGKPFGSCCGRKLKLATPPNNGAGLPS